jgi:hypothetical protein
MDLDSFFMPIERLLDSLLFGKSVIIVGASDKNMEILLRSSAKHSIHKLKKHKIS